MNMIQRLLLVAALATAAGTARTMAQPVFTPYTNALGNYTISMPPGVYQEDSWLDGIFRTPVKLTCAHTVNGDAHYVVAWGDAPDSIPAAADSVLIDAVRDKLARSCNAEVDREYTLFLGTVPYPGMEFTLLVKPAKPGKKGRRPKPYTIPAIGQFNGGACRIRVYIAKSRLYIIGIAIPSINPEYMDTFFDSFTLINM